MNGFLARIFGRDLPAEVSGALEGEERVLAAAGELVASSLGLWLPDSGGYRRVGWHLVSKAVWRGGELAVTEARTMGEAAGIVLLADLPERRFPLQRPGRLPEVVRRRVTGSVRSSHRRELPGGGAWIVQRARPGTSGVELQLRPDPGTDEHAVHELARQVASGLGWSGGGLNS